MSIAARAALTLALASAASLAAAAPGIARPHVKEAVFSISVKGSQATTWHMERPPDPALCGAAQHSDGDQMIRFHNNGPEQVVVTQRRGERPQLRLDTILEATAERNAEFQMDAVVGGRTGCTGIVHTPPFVQPGCGVRTGAISLALGYTADSVGDPAPADDDPAPLVPDRNHIRLRGIDPTFGGAGLLQAYQACPLFADPAARVETNGELLETQEKLRESRLFDRGVRTIKIHAGRVEDFTFGPATGRTAVAYNVTLRRAR